MRRNKILISLFCFALSALIVTGINSCVRDYFVDETNYRLFFPAIEENGGIDKNYDIYVYNSSTGNLAASKHLSPGTYTNDPFIREGIVRFTLPGGYKYVSYCFTELDGITFGGTAHLSSAYFALDESDDNDGLLGGSQTTGIYAEPAGFRYDTIARYIPVVLQVTTDTVEFAPYPANVALLFKLDRSALEGAIGTPIASLGRVSLVARGIDVPGGVLDENNSDLCSEKGIASRTNFDSFATTCQSDIDVMVCCTSDCVKYAGTGNLTDILAEYCDDPYYSSLGNDISLVLEHSYFPTVENRMLRLHLVFYDTGGTAKGGFSIDLKEADNRVVTLDPAQRRLFVIDRMLMLNLNDPNPWNPWIPGGGGDLH